MDRGAWRATVCGIAKNWTRLKQHSMHACTHSMHSWLKKQYFEANMFKMSKGNVV